MGNRVQVHHLELCHPTACDFLVVVAVLLVGGVEKGILLALRPAVHECSICIVLEVLVLFERVVHES